MADGSVVIEITGDNSKLKSAVEDTTKVIDKESAEWTSAGEASANSIGAAFEGMFTKLSLSAAAAKIGQLIRDWAIASVEMASSLEEVQNVVDVTFGAEGANKINNWSKIAASRYGLTELQAKKFASTIGSMAKGTSMADQEIMDMSMDLTGLAADMASMYNMSFDEAFNKIRAGLSGETEPLKAVGFDLSVESLSAYADQYGLGNYNDMDIGQKYALRYQYMMAMAAEKNMMGDFARTSGGYANTERIIETKKAEAQAMTGEALMPVVQDWQEDMLDFWNWVTGDDGIIITGGMEELTKDLANKQAQLEAATAPYNERIREMAASLGIEEEDFEPGVFGSFEEYAAATIRTRAGTFGGKEGERYKAADEELTAMQEQVQAAADAVADVEAQINKLSALEGDTYQEGYDQTANLAAGINAAAPLVSSAVDGVNSTLAGLGTGGSMTFNGGGAVVDGEHATGLDYVPFNGYLASLHEGESILTAEEARVWRAFQHGGQAISNTVDYDALGGVMRDNVRAGGNVYLDGQTVGRVISDRQANSYRALERSGWQR